MQSFASTRIEHEDDAMRPLIVFNPHAWPVKANVEIEMYKWKPEAVLVDDSGTPVPHQQVTSTTTTDRVRLAFTADLPALGYRVYRLQPSGTPGEFTTVQATDNTLENSRFRLEIDPATGFVSRLFDKQVNVEVFGGPAAVPVVIEDLSDTWGHDTFKYDKVIGQFEAYSVKLAEHGPVKSIIRVMSRYGASSLVQDFTMYPDRDQIDVAVTVNWQEQAKLLKFRFPVYIEFMRVTHECLRHNELKPTEKIAVPELGRSLGMSRAPRRLRFSCSTTENTPRRPKYATSAYRRSQTGLRASHPGAGRSGKNPSTSIRASNVSIMPCCPTPEGSRPERYTPRCRIEPPPVSRAPPPPERSTAAIGRLHRVQPLPCRYRAQAGRRHDD